MTGEQRKALRRFGGWAVLGGIVGGGLSWWARVSPVVGTAAQLAFVLAVVIFTLLLGRDTRRMDRERLEIERRMLECEQNQLKLLDGAIAEAAGATHQILRQTREALLIRSQISDVGAPPKKREDWMQ